MKDRFESLMPAERHELAMEIASKYLDLEDLGYYTQTEIPLIEDEEDRECEEDQLVRKVLNKIGLSKSVDTILRTCEMGPEELLSKINEFEYFFDMIGDTEEDEAESGFITPSLPSPEEKTETAIPEPQVEEETEILVSPGEARGFAAVAGLDSLKAEMKESVIWPLVHKKAAKRYRVSAPNGMLLYGPPGCGKTFFAQRFAEETGFRYRYVSPSDLGCKWIHGSQEMIAQLFEDAKKNAPCVVCLDEVDALLPTRSSTPELAAQNGEVNEFLTRLNNCGKDGIFVIGTTNNRNLIDPAALRKGRFDIQYEIPAPDSLQRKALFEKCLEDRPVDSDVDTSALSALTDGYVSSDISYIVDSAALKAAIAGVDISQKHLVDAVYRCSASCGKTEKKIGF